MFGGGDNTNTNTITTMRSSMRKSINFFQIKSSKSSLDLPNPLGIGADNAAPNNLSGLTAQHTATGLVLSSSPGVSRDLVRDMSPSMSRDDKTWLNPPPLPPASDFLCELVKENRGIANLRSMSSGNHSAGSFVPPTDSVGNTVPFPIPGTSHLPANAVTGSAKV